jgi:type III secretory pathway component EscS
VGLFAAYTESMRDKLRIAVTFLIVVIVLVAASYWYANGILPQVVSCVAESPPKDQDPATSP